MPTEIRNWHQLDAQARARLLQRPAVSEDAAIREQVETIVTAADGSYELIASAEPQPRNWLRLEPGAGSITTRHYWEWERNVAADPTFHVPL